MAVLSYELVRSLGIFERRRLVTAAVTVGFVYHVFYEFFDHVGPQLRWWIWNPSAPTNEPLLASVPLGSMVNFALAGPIVLTLLVRLLVSRHREAPTLPTRTLLGRSALVGLLIPLGLVIAGLPVTLAGGFGEKLNHTAQGVVYWTALVVVAAIAIAVLVDAHRSRADTQALDADGHRYLLTHASIWLGAMGVSWMAALPAYFAAVDGITSDGTPIGSLPYALWSLAASLTIAWLALAGWSTVEKASTPDVAAVQEQPAVPT